MSNGTPIPPPSSHLQGWAQVLLAFAAVIGAMTGTIGLFLQDRNGGKIDGVKQQAAEVREDLDAKRREERQSRLINLLGTWKWLEEIAERPGSTQRDRDNAAKAKQIYEEFRNGD